MLALLLILFSDILLGQKIEGRGYLIAGKGLPAAVPRRVTMLHSRVARAILSQKEVYLRQKKIASINILPVFTPIYRKLKKSDEIRSGIDQ
jgi:hypothetical protein